MTAEHATTRRVLLGGLTFASAAAALSATVQARDPKEDFIRQIAMLHENGEAAARHAMKAGMEPEGLYAIMFGTSQTDDPARWPALCFARGAKCFSFRPNGES